MTDYTVDRVLHVGHDTQLKIWILKNAPIVMRTFGNVYDCSHFNFDEYARQNCLWFCWRNGKPVGIMMAQFYANTFDRDVKILYQDLLYCEKSSGRAAYLLMDKFIAFGRANANLVFTMTTKHTNVKGRTLERLGFEKTEELYRLEV